MEQIFINPTPIDRTAYTPGSLSLPGDEATGGRFGDMLKEAISTVNDLQERSDNEIRRIMTGESDDLTGAVVATQKAGLSFQMMMQVRNKIVTAYQEVMRMQV